MKHEVLKKVDVLKINEEFILKRVITIEINHSVTRI